jgi:hypothetical protein
MKRKCCFNSIVYRLLICITDFISEKMLSDYMIIASPPPDEAFFTCSEPQEINYQSVDMEINHTSSLHKLDNAFEDQYLNDCTTNVDDQQYVNSHKAALSRECLEIRFDISTLRSLLIYGYSNITCE